MIPNKDRVKVSPTQPTTGEKVWLQKGKNLLDKIIVGGVSSTGILESNNTRLVSEKAIKVNSATIYTVSIETYNTSKGVPKVQVIFYDKNNSLISFSGWKDINYTFTTPNNCKYLRLIFYLSNSTNQILEASDISKAQLEQDSEVTNYEAYIEPKIYVKNDNGVYEEFISKDDNLQIYSAEEIVIGKWIDGKTLYRKTITYTPSDKIGEEGKVTDIYIPHGISDFNQLCGQKCTTSDGYILPTLGSKDNTILNYGTCIRAVTTDTINIRLVNDAWGVRTWYITLEYTKTTD